MKVDYQEQFWNLALKVDSTTLDAEKLLSKVSKRTVEFGFIFNCQAHKNNFIHWYLQNNNKNVKIQLSDKKITNGFASGILSSYPNQLSQLKEFEGLASKYNVNIDYQLLYRKAFTYNMQLEVIEYIYQKNPNLNSPKIVSNILNYAAESSQLSVVMWILDNHTIENYQLLSAMKKSVANNKSVFNYLLNENFKRPKENQIGITKDFLEVLRYTKSFKELELIKKHLLSVKLNKQLPKKQETVKKYKL